VTKGEATRETILAAGAEIAGRVGLTGLTIGQLAGSVEMSKSGLFAHFRSKEALQLQVLGHARESFIAQAILPALAAPRGEPRIRALFEHWLAVVRDGASSCLFLSASMEYDDQPGPVRDALVAAHRDLMDSVAQIFRTAVAEGHCRPDADPAQFAHDLHGAMLAYAYAHRLLREPEAEARTRRAVERLLDAARP
jgi:AcrR family transcriptional regulator